MTNHQPVAAITKAGGRKGKNNQRVSNNFNKVTCLDAIRCNKQQKNGNQPVSQCYHPGGSSRTKEKNNNNQRVRNNVMNIMLCEAAIRCKKNKSNNQPVQCGMAAIQVEAAAAKEKKNNNQCVSTNFNKTTSTRPPYPVQAKRGETTSNLCGAAATIRVEAAIATTKTC